MPDLVHDLAISLLGSMRSSYYALLADCSKALEWSCTSPATLVALCFRDCRRIELHSRAFESAKSLRILDLSECFIQKLPDSIGDLNQLRYLKAPGIQDRIIPRSITKLSKLNYLNLHGSYLVSELPESLGEMDGLMYLDLSGCSGLERLPESLGKLKRLLHLNLANCCRVKYVSELLGNLTQLEYLNLSHCLNIHLGLQMMGCLTNLEYLNLSRYFTGLKEHETFMLISSMVKLEHLDLSDNGCLTALPECIAYLRNIQKLDLSGCINLSKLPTALFKMDDLKTLILNNCISLDFEGLPHQLINSKDILKKFVVRAREGLSSNLVLLKDANNTDVLSIDGLENVKSTEEALKIGLMGKQNIADMTFHWNRDAKRFVKDGKVLENLVPPKNLRKFKLGGYTCEMFPYWLVGIPYYLPNLTSIVMENLPNCNSLPPLGQLKNLRELVMRGMDSITYIDESFYGGLGAFHQLRKFELCRMGGLQVWKTIYSYLEELMSPNLEYLTISDCPMLRILPYPPRALNCKIDNSDNDQAELPEWLGQLTTLRHLEICGRPYMDAPVGIMKQLTSLKSLCLSHCKTPTLPHWLVELTLLQKLEISDCPWLNNLPVGICNLICLEALVLRNCQSISVLPEFLGDLATLREFVIDNCVGIKILPESIQELTELEELAIRDCPDLQQWCELGENKMKLNHIKTKKQKDQCFRTNHSIHSNIENTTSDQIDLMTHAQLKEITNDFSKVQKIGQGAQGTVYWGIHKNGEKIAVKVLHGYLVELDDQQFCNEIRILTSLNHPNIVRLVGYCYEIHKLCVEYDGGKEFAEKGFRALCFEYLRHGSLDNYLRDENSELDWQTRYNIIKGTCEGLNYLRKGIGKPIYHLDLKPENILLDENLMPKLADFGLSKILHGDHTWTTKNVAGTLGYLPPEYLKDQKVSEKLDIYSLGVVIIKTIAGRHGHTKSAEMSAEKFIDYVYEDWRKRLQVKWNGSLLEAYCKQVKRCTELSLKCIESDRNNRPDIVDIIHELNEVEKH